MSTDHIVSLLVAERDKLSRAIEALQGPAKRRGRPPKLASLDESPSVSRRVPSNAPPLTNQRKKRTFTAAQRKEQAARMKAYWAAKRKAAK
jgi:hypothetical protein